jgi:hypothetical protein
MAAVDLPEKLLNSSNQSVSSLLSPSRHLSSTASALSSSRKSAFSSFSFACMGDLAANVRNTV